MTASLRLRMARGLTRNIQRPILERALDPKWARLRVGIASRLFLRGRAPFAFRTGRLGGVSVRRRPGGRGTLFHIHGGAFMLFSAHTHQGLAARLAAPLGLEPVLPDYRLAPEHPFPQGLDDVTAAWEGLGEGPRVLSGDSAGGGLAMSLLHRIVARGLTPPDAVVLFSPWVDLTASGASLSENADADPLLPASRLPDVIGRYLAGADPRDPEASPIFGTFAGAPPVLIQVAVDEILLSDAETLAERLRAQGVEARLSVLPHAIHAFQMLHGWLPEADRALDEATAFATEVLGRPRA